MDSYEITAEVRVRVIVNDGDVIVRVVENHDSEGIPQDRLSIDEGGTGWQDTLYNMPEGERSVIEMLAYNCIRNGVREANRLDGWADMPKSAAEMYILDVEFYDSQLLKNEERM